MVKQKRKKSDTTKSKLRAQHDQLVAKHESLQRPSDLSNPPEDKEHRKKNIAHVTENDHIADERAAPQVAANRQDSSENAKPDGKSGSATSPSDLEVTSSREEIPHSFQQSSPINDVPYGGPDVDFHLNEEIGPSSMLSRLWLWVGGITGIVGETLSSVTGSTNSTKRDSNVTRGEYETIIDGHPDTIAAGVDMYNGIAQGGDRTQSRNEFLSKCIIS